jgi:hypothetical protein
MRLLAKVSPAALEAAELAADLADSSVTEDEDAGGGDEEQEESAMDTTEILQRGLVSNALARSRESGCQFKEGLRVEVNFLGKGKYYPGRISQCRRNDTYDIYYDDGERQREVGARMIRPLQVAHV